MTEEHCATKAGRILKMAQSELNGFLKMGDTDTECIMPEVKKASYFYFAAREWDKFGRTAYWCWEAKLPPTDKLVDFLTSEPWPGFEEGMPMLAHPKYRDTTYDTVFTNRTPITKRGAKKLVDSANLPDNIKKQLFTFITKGRLLLPSVKRTLKKH